MQGFRSGFFWPMLATSLAACTAPQPYVSSADLGQGQSIVTDAKARVIASFPAENVKNTSARSSDRKERIVCAEPSPDVAQSISEAIRASLELDLSKLATADKSNNKTLGLDFSRSATESVAQLGERLAVIQLLRDKMYRVCEAYANGAIGEAAYTLILARHDKTMMSLLSNELAAGAFGRDLVVIGGVASTSGLSGEQLTQQQKVVEDKKKELDAADPAKPDDMKKASEALSTEVEKLLFLERQVFAHAGSTTNTQQPGRINGLTRSTSGNGIENIHRQYIDDDGLDPLIDACIIGMERSGRQIPDSAREALRKKQAAAIEAKDALRKLAYAIDSKQRGIIELRGMIEGIEIEANRLNKPGKSSRNLDDSMSSLNQQKNKYETEIKAIQKEIESLKAQRDQTDQIEEVKLVDLFIESGSLFGAFCYDSVLSSGSQFVSQRMKQKRQLRGIEPTDEAILAKKIDLCEQALNADEKTLPAKERGVILSGCSAALLASTNTDSLASKQLGFCTNLMLSNDKKTGSIKTKFVPMCQTLLKQESVKVRDRLQ